MAGARHILLVQDDHALRQIHRLNLELGGFTVVEASDGAEALRLAHQSPPDLVILDLALQSLDGWEALGELKTDANLRAIPVVILTSSAEESQELRALERGPLAFLAKPLGIEDLIAAVRKVLPRPPP